MCLYCYLVVVLTFVPGISYTQVHDGTQLVTATVLSGTTNFSRPFTIGVKLNLVPGWHTYWKNPGDFGAPLDIEAVGAEPYRLGPIQYPTPQKFSTEFEVTYGYDDSVIVLVQVFPPKDAHDIPPPAFDIKVKWLVCSGNICLPGDAALRFEPAKLNPAGMAWDKALIDRWTARLPQPGIGYNFESGNITLAGAGDKLLLHAEFPGSSPNTITDFFPEEIRGFVLDHMNIRITDTGFEFPLVRSEPSARLDVLKGIVMVESQGYDVTIPIHTK